MPRYALFAVFTILPFLHCCVGMGFVYGKEYECANPTLLEKSSIACDPSKVELVTKQVLMQKWGEPDGKQIKGSTEHWTYKIDTGYIGVVPMIGIGIPLILPLRNVEHPAVMQPARHLREQGWAIDIVPVDASGRVALGDIACVLRPDTALISVMHTNNEVGTVQPIAEIAALAHANGSLMHTDVAQSAGKIGLDVDTLGADLLTLAVHKFYAPKGIGALYIRQGTPIKPLLFGAEQEHGLRPGTENVMHIVGLGTAARLARQRLTQTTQRLAARREQLHGRLQEAIPGLQLNGHALHRLPNTLHVSFPGIAGRDLLAQVSVLVAASQGSACHGLRPSALSLSISLTVIFWPCAASHSSNGDKAAFTGGWGMATISTTGGAANACPSENRNETHASVEITLR